MNTQVLASLLRSASCLKHPRPSALSNTWAFCPVSSDENAPFPPSPFTWLASTLQISLPMSHPLTNLTSPPSLKLVHIVTSASHLICPFTTLACIGGLYVSLSEAP